MAFPKVVILAMGGSHGDFMCEICRFMLNNLDVNIDENGKIKGNSILKKNLFYSNGKRNPMYMDQIKKLELVELSHVWYDEFVNWPSNFFCIRVDEELIPTVSRMHLEKNFGGDKQAAFDDCLEFWPKDLREKIEKKKLNFFDFYKDIIIRAEKKYRKHPKLSSIKMTDLYDLQKLKQHLMKMHCYDPEKEDTLTQIHSQWLKKNEKYIFEIFKLRKK